MTTHSPPQNPPQFFDMLLAYKTSAMLTAGIDLGIFGAVDELTAGGGEATSNAVAQRLGLSERGARLLLNALAALGLLESDGMTYELTQATATYLVPGSPRYLGDMTKVMVSRWEWEAFGALADAVRRGGPVIAEHAEMPEYRYWEQFARYVGAVARPTAELVASQLADWAAARPRLDVLDVACGHGLYGYILAGQQPHARVWSLDRPNVLALARKNAADLGVADRATMLSGDMFDVPLGGPYDLVLVANTLHHFSTDRCLALLRRLARVTADDGRIVLVGFMTREVPPAQDAAAHLFSILMLAWTYAGEVHAERIYRSMLQVAGFGEATLNQVPGLPLSVIVADRRDR
jgi:C-methyltransferase